MGFEQRENLTTIRIVFEAHNGSYRAHTIDYLCKTPQEDDRMVFVGLLHYRRSVLRDFQEVMLLRLGEVGITGACVYFEALANTEYARREEDCMAQDIPEQRVA